MPQGEQERRIWSYKGLALFGAVCIAARILLAILSPAMSISVGEYIFFIVAEAAVVRLAPRDWRRERSSSW